MINMPWWLELLLYGLGGIFCIVILFWLWYLLSKQILKRRYKEENDRTRPIQDFRGPEPSTSKGTGNALVERRRILSDENVESSSTDSRQSEDARTEGKESRRVNEFGNHSMSFHERRRLWLK